MKTRLLVLFALFTAATAPRVAAQPVASASAPDSAQATEIVEAFRRALAAGDSAAVAGMLRPGAVILESGRMETKREYLGHHFHADHAFLSEMSTTLQKQEVRVGGDVAWINSTRRMQGASGGRDLDLSSAELMVLRRAGPEGEWKISAIHWSSRSRE